MSDLHKKCEECFDTCDFYEVLQVDRTATAKEIKKAYYKISLLVHPDRVEESKKQYATEKFKILGRIHSILQDPETRKIYDDTGEFDEENYSASCNWMDYWRSMFKKISVKDIQNYEKEYIGSDTELRDIKKAYVIGKGSMDIVLEMVPFSNCDSEPRIIEVVQKMVDEEEVEYYENFFNESPRKKNRRRKMYDAEEKEAAKVDLDELTQEIQKRQGNFNSFLSQLEDKYSGNGSAKKSRKSIENGTTNGKTSGRKRGAAKKK